MMAKTSSSDQPKLLLLAETASYRLDELLDALGVSLSRRGRMLAGRCPVHGGDNPSAFNLYPDGHSVRGNWKCRSRFCQKTFQPTLLGFVRGVLSHQKYSWSNPNDKMVPFREAVDYLCDFIGKKLDDLKVDEAENEKRQFVAQMATFNKTVETVIRGSRREDVRSRLTIPSPYFLSRGYKAEVLDFFDAGEPSTSDPKSPMFTRAVIPVYDQTGKKAIGYTGRTLHNRCPKCDRWHAPASPCLTRSEPSGAKWRHHGFRAESTLFNAWNAEPHIRKSGHAVVVEGPLDVFRLWQAGVRNCVALFGVSMEDPQQILLETMGVARLTLLLNQDEAGRKAATELASRLNRCFTINVPSFAGGKDLEHLSDEEIQWLVKT